MTTPIEEQQENERMMIAARIKNAIEGLNRSLHEAWDADLTVEISSVDMRTMGKQGSCEVYSARIKHITEKVYP